MIALETGFKIMDLITLSVEDVRHGADFGAPLKALPLDTDNPAGLMLLCYENLGVITTVDSPAHELKRLLWRQVPLTFVVKLTAENSDPAAKSTNTLFAVGSTTTIDVWSLELAKIVHIFETKKDRIKRLGFLLAKKGNHLLVVADEEKDGQSTSSVIHIHPEGAGPLMETATH